MARTVVIASVTRNGESVQCSGTVDGVQADCNVWWSYLVQLPNNAARQTAIAQALAAAAPAPVPQPLTGTVLV